MKESNKKPIFGTPNDQSQTAAIKAKPIGALAKKVDETHGSGIPTNCLLHACPCMKGWS
jgi:hypothetical protein